MRIAVIMLSFFLCMPLYGQKKWERMNGNFHRHLERSEFDDALDDAFLILEYAGENYDSADRESALANYNVAKAYEVLGKPKEAQAYIRNAHALLIPDLAFDEFTAEVTLLYGKIQTKLGYHSSARVLLSSALEISMDLSGPESEPYLQSLYAMADLEMAMARWEQMISILVDALQIHERNFPLDHAYAMYANYLGLLYLNSELFQEAILYLGKAISAYQPRVLKEDLTCANAHNNLGLIYYNQSEFELAARHFEKAASIYPELTETYSENYLMLLSNRASLYTVWGKEALRESSYQELGEYLDLNAGRFDLPYIQGLENMANFYAEMGQFAESEALYLRSIQAQKSTSPVDREALQRTLRSLVSLCEEFYEIEKALYYLRKADALSE